MLINLFFCFIFVIVKALELPVNTCVSGIQDYIQKRTKIKYMQTPVGIDYHFCLQIQPNAVKTSSLQIIKLRPRNKYISEEQKLLKHAYSS